MQRSHRAKTMLFADSMSQKNIDHLFSVHLDLVYKDHSPDKVTEVIKEFKETFDKQKPGSRPPWVLVDYDFSFRLGRRRVDEYSVRWFNPWTKKYKFLTLDLKNLTLIGMRDDLYGEPCGQKTAYFKLLKDERGILSLIVFRFATVTDLLVTDKKLPYFSQMPCLQDFDHTVRCPCRGTLEDWCFVHHGDPNHDPSYIKQYLHNKEKRALNDNELFQRASEPRNQNQNPVPIVQVFKNVFNVLSPEEEKKKEDEQRLREQKLMDEEREREQKEAEEKREAERIRLEAFFDHSNFPLLNPSLKPSAETKQPQKLQPLVPDKDQGTAKDQGTEKGQGTAKDHGTDKGAKNRHRVKYTKINLKEL